MIVSSASPRRSTRRAAAALEFALLTPFFLVLILGVIEFGRAMMVQGMLVNAAREGARAATLPLETDAQVTATVSNYMSTVGISGYTETLSPTLASNPASGTNLTLTIYVPWSDVSWVPSTPIMSYFSGGNLQAKVVMMKQ